MRLSAEIRWFWKEHTPSDVVHWFCSDFAHPFAAGGGQERFDYYLRDPGTAELGIKRRGSGTEVEIKVLASRGNILDVAPFVGRVEVWTKVSTAAVAIAENPQVRIGKQRWLRTFDTSGNAPTELALDRDELPRDKALPARGCNIELTKVLLASGERWFTLGFEAYGTLENIQSDLASVAAELAARQAPSLASATLASYPEWLSRLNRNAELRTSSSSAPK